MPRSSGMLTSAYLALMAAMFAAFGLWSMLQPCHGRQPRCRGQRSQSAYELRGVYGGISLGAALFCAAYAMRENLRRPALWFIAVYMGGYLFARAAALFLGPPPAGYAAFIAFEAASFLLAALCLRALPAPETRSPAVSSGASSVSLSVQINDLRTVMPNVRGWFEIARDRAWLRATAGRQP